MNKEDHGERAQALKSYDNPLVTPPVTCTMVAEVEDAPSSSRSLLCVHERAQDADGGSALLCPS